MAGAIAPHSHEQAPGLDPLENPAIRRGVGGVLSLHGLLQAARDRRGFGRGRLHRAAGVLPPARDQHRARQSSRGVSRHERGGDRKDRARDVRQSRARRRGVSASGQAHLGARRAHRGGWRGERQRGRRQRQGRDVHLRPFRQLGNDADSRRPARIRRRSWFTARPTTRLSTAGYRVSAPSWAPRTTSPRARREPAASSRSSDEASSS